MTMTRRFTIGKKIYVSVLSLFLLFAIAFIVFQQYRERQYKVETLTLRLQDCNDQIHDAIMFNHDSDMGSFLRLYLRKGSFRNLRDNFSNLNSSAELVDDRSLPLYEVALLYMLACIGNESQIEREVVDAGYLHRQEFLCLEEVM